MQTICFFEFFIQLNSGENCTKVYYPQRIWSTERAHAYN